MISTWGDFMVYKRLRELRIEHGLGQKEIGAILGITQRAYSYYERGQHTIPPQLLVMLADYYQVSVDYLLDRTDKEEG